MDDMSTGPLPMFPLSGVLFPHAPLTLHVFEARYRQMTADCMAGDRLMGVVLITRGSEVGGNDERSGVGTVARIEEALPSPDGRWFLLLSGQRRIGVTEWLVDDPYPRAMVEDRDDPDDQAVDPTTMAEALASIRRVRRLMSEAGQGPPIQVQPTELHPDPLAAAWQLCHLTPVGPLDRQRLLETAGSRARMELVARYCDEQAEDLRLMLSGG
jgi:Lon protease-like protein